MRSSCPPRRGGPWAGVVKFDDAGDARWSCLLADWLIMSACLRHWRLERARRTAPPDAPRWRPAMQCTRAWSPSQRVYFTSRKMFWKSSSHLGARIASGKTMPAPGGRTLGYGSDLQGDLREQRFVLCHGQTSQEQTTTSTAPEDRSATCQSLSDKRSTSGRLSKVPTDGATLPVGSGNRTISLDPSLSLQ